MPVAPPDASPAIELVNVNRRFLSPDGKSFTTLRDFNMTVAAASSWRSSGPRGAASPPP
jgi:NitT/TauT family transport system ATP-binding protein